ncbi:MAG: hypothetical protein Q4F54_02150 [Coriobacteriia bacterium]|nr:hypothetical protein [Coriobacteriia bacterium]
MFAGYNFPVRSFGDKKVVSTEAANIDFGEHSFADDADLTSMFAFASANLDFSDFDLSNA